MKCLFRSRNLVAAVLVLLLTAASAPAALALPAGPGGSGGSGWDVQAFFDWVQGLLGGFFGGVDGDEGPGLITGKVRADADINGHDLQGTSTAISTEESTTLRDQALGR